MWLLIDDSKDLSSDVIARTYEAGMMLLQAHKWEVLMIDHDLGEGRRSGYDLIMEAWEKRILPSNVQIVSLNSVGRDRLEAALRSFGYVYDNNHHYWVREEVEG